MPTTTRSRTETDSRTALELELEALGAGIAPGLPGDETGERERAGLGAGHPRRGAPAADPPRLPAAWLMRRWIAPRAAAVSGKL